MEGSGQLLVITGQTGLAIASLGIGGDHHVVKLGRGHHPDIGELPAHCGDAVNNGGSEGGAAATSVPPNNHTTFPTAYSALTKEKLIVNENERKQLRLREKRYMALLGQTKI